MIGEPSANQVDEEDVKLQLEILQDLAIKDSKLGAKMRNMVDYTLEELKKLTEEEGDEEKPNWRPDPFEYIRDLILPGMNLEIPEPIGVPSCAYEQDDRSTDSDEPSSKK